jgi:hypothetical protein
VLNGIIQWLRLKLDDRARQNLVREARATALQVARSFKEAGDEAGDAFEKGVEDGLKDAEKDAERTAKRTEGAFKRAVGGIRGFFSGLGGIIAGIGFGAFIKDMWELGTAAEETQSKFNVTFGQQAAADVQQFLDSWASLAGMNRTVGQDFAATSSAIVQGMGATRAESAAFSKQWLKLAGDLVSYHNAVGGVEETFGAIKSGLVGSFEPLERFGIVIRQTTVNQRALADTGKTNEKQLTELERAQAALNLMYERAGPALGDLERTQGSTANKARNLKAEFDNLRIGLARNLLPIFAALIDWTIKNKSSLGEMASAAGVVARVVGGVLWQAFNSIASMLSGTVASAMGTSIFLYRSLEGVILRAIYAKERFKRAFGAGSDEAVAAAGRAVTQNALEIREAGRLMREGAKEYLSAFSADAFNQVWNLRPAEGEFDWSSVGPDRAPPKAPVDPKEAERLAREREQELSDQVRLLEEMATRRAEFPELVEKATALEKLLTSEMESGNVSTKRRLTLLNETESLKKIIAGTDATSLQLEKQRQTRLEEQVDLVEKLFDRYGHKADVIAHSAMIEATLRQELENQNIQLERQLEIMDQLQRIAQARASTDPDRFTRGDESNPLFMEDVDAVLDHWQGVADMMAAIADGWADAWEAAFNKIVVEGGSAAEAMVVFGRTMGGAVLGALASFARGKMQENVAAAIEELAYAASAFAWGNAPKGAAHLKSAATHGISAAAWGVMAGIAGGAAGAVSGATGSSSSRSGGDTVDSSRGQGPEVHVYLDPINENNPTHQKVILAAGRNGDERYGSANVSYHPRTGSGV